VLELGLGIRLRRLYNVKRESDLLQAGMTDIFLIKLVLSFFVGGAWVMIATLLADKHGTKIGGLVAGLPSTALISLFFIGWTQSPAAAVEATTVIPLIGAVNALFLLVYISLVRANFWTALSSSLLFWCLSSFAIVILKFNDFYLSLVIYFIVVPSSFFIVEKGIKVKSKAARKTINTLGTILFRGLFSGLIIALAVIMGKIGSPLLGGMFAMFPAMFTGTLLITFLTHGPLFSSAMMKVALISAISVVLYAVLVRYSYIPLGLLGGTLVSMAISFAAACLLHIFIVKKIS
jgi:uncharacterized membrane protein (GlpM family)